LILLVEDKVRSFVSIYDNGNNMISTRTSKHITSSKLPFQASKHHLPCASYLTFADISLNLLSYSGVRRHVWGH